MGNEFILIEGARQNNLKGVTVRVPIGAVTAVTGVAGAGKSSLAFEVLYAEGYRRYVETFSPYARQFLERLDRPRAERIEGVLPSIAIDRTAPVRTSRSTVGTMTSIADYLRSLYARAATLHCRGCGEPVERHSPSSIFEALLDAAEGEPALICFPASVGPRQQGGAPRVLSSSSAFAACSRTAVRCRSRTPAFGPRRAASRSCSIGSPPGAGQRERIVDSLEQALRFGKGRLELRLERLEEPLRFSEALRCERCEIDYADPTPALFSFNNPIGACPTCRGFGRTVDIDPDLVVPNPRLSVASRLHQAVPDPLLRRLSGGPGAVPGARGDFAGRRLAGPRPEDAPR